MRSSFGPIDINGQSGKKLLHGALDDEGTKRKLSLASVNCMGDPRAVVTCDSQTPGHYRIYGRQGNINDAASLKAYGIMEYVGSRLLLSVEPQWRDPTLTTTTEAEPVLQVDPTSHGELHLKAFNVDGRTKLAYSDLMTLKDGSEGWRLIVSPGEDAILILACMLTMLLFPAPSVSGIVTPSLPGASARASLVPAASSTQALPQRR